MDLSRGCLCIGSFACVALPLGFIPDGFAVRDEASTAILGAYCF